MKDEPAFPHWRVAKDLSGDVVKHGLTKREYFAAMAMQGLLAGIYSSKEMLREFKDRTGRDYISENARSYADALIAELEKEE